MHQPNPSECLNYVLLATAREFGAVLWTQDADFDGLDGVRFFPKGKR